MNEEEIYAIEEVLKDITILDDLNDKDYFLIDDYMNTRKRMIERISDITRYYHKRDS